MDTVRYVQFISAIWGALACLIMIVSVAYHSHVDKKSAFMFLAILANNFVLCVSDAVSLGFRGNESEVGYVMVRAGKFLVFFSSILMGSLVARYIDYLMGVNDRRHESTWLFPVYVMTALDSVLLVLSQHFNILYAFDEHNRYYRKEWFPVFIIIGLLEILYINYNLVRKRTKLDRMDFLCFMICSLIPFWTVVAQFLLYGFSFSAFGYVMCQTMLFIRFGIKRTNRILELEKKHSRDRINMLRAQISPHFIFNSLTSLQELCLEDPVKASNGIKQFSRYLRGNLEAMNNAELIPFSQELAYIDEYISLEKLDPSREIDIVYELGITDFSVPVLSVEPLVENALQHGIAFKKEGKIIVRSFEKDDQIVVTVEDNGVGENVKSVTGAGHRGVAFANIKERIALQCNGTVDVERLDPGRRVSVRIPLNGGKNEDNYSRRQDTRREGVAPNNGGNRSFGRA